MATRVAALAATLAACGLPGASSFVPAERFITGTNVGAQSRPDAHCHPSDRPRQALPAHPSAFPRGFGSGCCSRLVLGSTLDPSNNEDDDAIDSEVVPDWDVDYDVADGDMDDSVSRISNDDRSDDGTRVSAPRCVGRRRQCVAASCPQTLAAQLRPAAAADDDASSSSAPSLPIECCHRQPCYYVSSRCHDLPPLNYIAVNRTRSSTSSCRARRVGMPPKRSATRSCSWRRASPRRTSLGAS